MARTPGRPAAASDTPSREQLLHLAFNAFCSHGFDGVSIRKLAKSIGVSDSLFIHHFKSKKQLWFEVVDTHLEQEFQQLIQQLRNNQQTQLPLDLLKSYIKNMIEVASNKPAMFQLIFSELEQENERSQYVREKYLRPFLTAMDHALEQCVEEKHIAPMSNTTLHTMMLGSVSMILKPGFLYQGFDPQDHCISNRSQELVEFLFRGMGIDPR